MGLEVTEGVFVNDRGQKLRTYAYVPDDLRCVLFFHHGFAPRALEADTTCTSSTLPTSRPSLELDARAFLSFTALRSPESTQAAELRRLGVLVFCEYSGRAGLPLVFRAWAKAGIAVHTFDAHGHGYSEPTAEEDRFLIWDFNHVVEDYAAFTKSIRATYAAGVPMFLGGHSMGSLATIHVALRDQSLWNGLVLGTATVDVEWNWFLRLQASVGSLLAMLIPRACIVPTAPADVNATPALAEKIEADPLLATGKVRARTANEILRAFAHVQRDGHLLWLPLYAHHGTADHLANIQAVRSLLQRCASPDVTMHEIAGGAHELFVGVERELVTGHVAAWIEGQLSAQEDGAGSDASDTIPGSFVSLTGDPFDWQAAYASPMSSIYGGSPNGGSPVDTPRACNDNMFRERLADDTSHCQEQFA